MTFEIQNPPATEKELRTVRRGFAPETSLQGFWACSDAYIVFHPRIRAEALKIGALTEYPRSTRSRRASTAPRTRRISSSFMYRSGRCVQPASSHLGCFPHSSPLKVPRSRPPPLFCRTNPCSTSDQSQKTQYTGKQQEHRE